MNKKAIIIGIVSAITIAGFLIWRQYRKLLAFRLKFRSVKLNKINMNELSFTVGLNFENTSDIQVVLTNQLHKVYINNVFIADIKSNKEDVIKAKSTSPLTFNVSVGSKGIGQLLKSVSFAELLNFKELNLRISSALDVKVGQKVVKVNSDTQDTIKNWQAA